ncbi:MAG TPA: GAF domain-containing protein [Terriglobales bacterium]|nr:GAF domain-containing protein [Terriglobales bacterium]
MQRLSPYQSTIGRLVALGYSNRDIAAELKTSEQAVKSALHVIFDKLGVWNRVELVNIFFSNGANGETAALSQRLELGRQAALKNLVPLGPLQEQELVDLVMVAATLCQTPIALLCIAEAHRVCFRAERGLGMLDADREISFCKHAIMQSKVFEVKDTSRDDRFKEHPFVVGNPHIRYYAGLPLLDADGYAVGTFCVIDKVPRELSAAQHQALGTLARLALRLLHGEPSALVGSPRKAQHGLSVPGVRGKRNVGRGWSSTG